MLADSNAINKTNVYSFQMNSKGYPKSFVLQPIDIEDVSSDIKNIKSHSAHGIDNFLQNL